VALAFSSCKSSESAYKKAYEKAQQQEVVTTTTNNGVQAVTPVVTNTPTTTTTTVTEVPSNVRQERVTVDSGTGLKDYSVVCGSFGVRANAESLKSVLDRDGYNAIVVYNASNNMYRVIAQSFDDYSSAVRARDSFKARYPNRSDFQSSWILYRLK